METREIPQVLIKVKYKVGKYKSMKSCNFVEVNQIFANH